MSDIDPNLPPPPADTPPPAPAPPNPPVPAPPSGGGTDENQWIMLTHLSPLVTGFLGPLVVWLMKKDQAPRIANQAKETLNFVITVYLAVLAIVVGTGILIFLFQKIGFLAGLVGLVATLAYIGVGIGALIFLIKAAIAANKGRDTRYPYSLRLIK